MEEQEAPRRPGRPARPVTREQLLKVASEAFSQLGYAGASMGDIAARAGIRKSSLFHHFATKDELYRDVLAGCLDGIFKHVSEALVSDAPFLDRMRNTSRAIQVYLGQHPVAARLLLREFVDGGQAFATAGDTVDMILRQSASLLEQGMNEGVIPRADARQLVMSAAGIHILHFALPEVTTRLFAADPFGAELVEARVDAAVEHILRVIGAKRG